MCAGMCESFGVQVLIVAAVVYYFYTHGQEEDIKRNLNAAGCLTVRERCFMLSCTLHWRPVLLPIAADGGADE